ncbi:MAG TPA: ATP-dependent DNA helicase [Solirubrobacteraceae bacterium]|nr:ATP-dependent DNA helicase [Solirubrobacteraceae bacterium]
MSAQRTGPLEGLSGAQLAAVTHEGGPLVVSGPAGSGKTRVLEARFAWLAERGVAPERMLALAPSSAAADAMRARLVDRLEQAYEELIVGTPGDLAARLLHDAGIDPFAAVVGAADRLAMLLERIDDLPLRRHDFGGSPSALLGGFVRRIDRLKAELIEAGDYAAWAATLGDDEGAALEREFAEVYRAHERMLGEAGARDGGDLIREALRLARERPEVGARFAHVLVDDAHELDLAPVSLVQAVAGAGLTAAGDPHGAVRRFRGAGGPRMEALVTGALLGTDGRLSAGARLGTDGRGGAGARLVTLERSIRCPERVLRAAFAALPGVAPPPAAPGGEVVFWRCANERAQAQSVAAEIERLIAREGVEPGAIAILVPSIAHDGQAVAVALEERAVPHRLVGEAAFFHRAEVRDLLAWLRLLADPADAPAVVRALARPPIELRSVDIARCTNIARRRKLDMVAALAAATESPQVPPEARERIRVFLKLYRSAMAALDTTRPDLYVHRLIERLGLRRQQLFAAQADVVQRLRALARFGELASAYVRRAPQATPREFARQVAAVAEAALPEEEEPEAMDAREVQVMTLQAGANIEADHVYVLGLHAGVTAAAPEPIADDLLREALPPDTPAARERALGQLLYVAMSRARTRLVLAQPGASDRGAGLAPSPVVEEARIALGGEWESREEELFGPAETLHSTYRMLRDELLEGMARTGGRLSELRFDTDIDISHAVVRYLELLKLSALIARPEGQGMAEAIRDVNARILQAVTSEQREIFTSSPLDDYLLDAERDDRRRAQAMVAREEPSLEPFLPKRGAGLILSASDIDTYRTCPLKYKFARVFRIPQEPTIHQRFGILVHQVLERFHAGQGAGSESELLGLLDAGWRRGGFGDSEEERQLRAKATTALVRYHTRSQSEESEPLWFEKSFAFKVGPHLLRGRVDRVDRLPGGEYELIDYKTGRPKSQAQLAEDVQLSLYALGAREAWRLDASRQAYYYLLDDQKVALSHGESDREWILDVTNEVAEGILSQGFEPTPSFAACTVCDYRLVCPAAER